MSLRAIGAVQASTDASTGRGVLALTLSHLHIREAASAGGRASVVLVDEAADADGSGSFADFVAALRALRASNA